MGIERDPGLPKGRAFFSTVSLRVYSSSKGQTEIYRYHTNNGLADICIGKHIDTFLKLYGSIME